MVYEFDILLIVVDTRRCTNYWEALAISGIWYSVLSFFVFSYLEWDCLNAEFGWRFRRVESYYGTAILCLPFTVQGGYRWTPRMLIAFIVYLSA